MTGRISRWLAAWAWVAFAMGAAQSAQAQGPLTVVTSSLPATTTASDYKTSIAVKGGTPPYNWQVLDGKLPPGMKLDPKRGTIAGTPATPGEYSFSVAVGDSSAPANRAERIFKIVVTAALTIDWKQLPQVNGQKLSGSVVVNNQTPRSVLLTVIVMAVNDIGRATALGYQEFTLASGAQQVIPFGSEPGPGKYVVHADAVGEVAATNTIYRARKQTSEKLVIQEMQ